MKEEELFTFDLGLGTLEARKREVEPSMSLHNDEDSDDTGGPKVKVSVLAKMSGVPAATIKHYVREGLLPEPSRTSKNMAYYEVALVPRIKKIKELQRTRFLPLKVIKQVLDESELDTEDETVGATIARVLEQTAPAEQRSMEELIAAGMPAEQLEWLTSSRLVNPLGEGESQVFAGDDLELMRVLGAARKAGITPEMHPVTILGECAQALRTLAIALRHGRPPPPPPPATGTPPTSMCAPWSRSSCVSSARA